MVKKFLSGFFPNFFLFVLLMLNSFSCQENGYSKENQQTKVDQKVGGPCDGCELINEGIPEIISSADTSHDWALASKKLLIEGKTINNKGGESISGVILYYWHTDSSGVYSKAEDQQNGQRHGKLRGWVKTDEQGRFRIYTSFPASYPNSTVSSHIHVVVKEAGLSEYYINAWEFIGDPYLDPETRDRKTARGGYGILKLDTVENGYIAYPTIILGRNIPDHPDL